MSIEKETADRAGAVSILMAVHDQADELRRNLPVLLSQNYAPGYEVIVVDESSTDDTDDVLTQLKAQYPQLYTTYIPASSHYVSRKKLALTLGMKAAHHEWVIITEATCRPESDKWIEAMSEGMTETHDVVCAYTAFDEGTKGRYAFLRMVNWRRQLYHNFRYDGACLALRKTVFMQRNGFLRNLQFLRGEFDFLVNETPCERVCLLTTAESRMRQEEPTVKSWGNAQLYYMQTRSHLARTTLSRVSFVARQLLLHLSYIAAIGAIVVGAYLPQPVAMAVGTAMLPVLVAVRTWIAQKRLHALGEHIALWKLPALDLGVAWHYAYFKCRYLMADKYDFKRK